MAYYKPKTTVEYSEISRMEKIHTDIFASSVEGAVYVADQIEKEIKAAQHEGKYYVMALGTGLSLTPIYNELQKRCEAKQLSFRNVVAFNAYEYYPIAKESSLKSINQLKERFLDHIDIDPQNIFTLDGSVAQAVLVVILVGQLQDRLFTSCNKALTISTSFSVIGNFSILPLS